MKVLPIETLNFWLERMQSVKIFRILKVSSLVISGRVREWECEPSDRNRCLWSPRTLSQNRSSRSFSIFSVGTRKTCQHLAFVVTEASDTVYLSRFDHLQVYVHHLQERRAYVCKGPDWTLSLQKESERKGNERKVPMKKSEWADEMEMMIVKRRKKIKKMRKKRQRRMSCADPWEKWTEFERREIWEE